MFGHKVKVFQNCIKLSDDKCSFYFSTFSYDGNQEKITATQYHSGHRYLSAPLPIYYVDSIHFYILNNYLT